MSSFMRKTEEIVRRMSTELCEVEKTEVVTLENIEFAEIGPELMDAFNRAGKEIL